jgi:hypothetical protein
MCPQKTFAAETHLAERLTFARWRNLKVENSPTDLRDIRKLTYSEMDEQLN